MPQLDRHAKATGRLFRVTKLTNQCQCKRSFLPSRPPQICMGAAARRAARRRNVEFEFHLSDCFMKRGREGEPGLVHSVVAKDFTSLTQMAKRVISQDIAVETSMLVCNWHPLTRYKVITILLMVVCVILSQLLWSLR